MIEMTELQFHNLVVMIIVVGQSAQVVLLGAILWWIKR